MAERERTVIATSHAEPEPLKTALAQAQKDQTSKRSSVRPQTSFEYSTSAANTPFGSDDEAEISNIKRAQHLSIQVSTIDNSIPYRTVRSIVRGDFDHLNEQREDGRRRNHRYLVATDLSEESVYALEWTIGTILRDGDTIIAVYSKEKDLGKEAEGETAKATSHLDSGFPTEDESSTPDLLHNSHSPRGFFGRLSGASTPDHNKSHPHHQKSHSHSHSHAHAESSKSMAERTRAVESITQTCVRLLRKTLLQVQVAVEVIHCRSPRHMITEAVSLFHFGDKGST